MIFVNFKTYETGSGKAAASLVKILEEVAGQTQVKTIPVVQAPDVKEIASFSKLEIWVQSIDPVGYGAYTGAILPEAVFEDGARGTFLNHSEKKIDDFATLELLVNRSREVGLKNLVFAAGLEELRKNASLKPDFLAYEPPELIGSTTTSVATAQPEIIVQAVEIAKAFGIPLIVGAGVHSREDVKKSLELGAVGVAVAKDILAAQDPKAELLDLTEGFR